MDRYIHTLIEKRGRNYIPAPLPKDIKRGRIGDCFDVCVGVTLLHPEKYHYVEGIATINKKEYYHSWLTDGKHAYDPTWVARDNKTGEEVVAPVTYKGIRFKNEDVWKFMYKTDHKGIIINRGLASDLFFEILKRTT